jgi:hypothetical protein
MLSSAYSNRGDRRRDPAALANALNLGFDFSETKPEIIELQPR